MQFRHRLSQCRLDFQRQSLHYSGFTRSDKALTQKVNDTSGVTPLVVIPGYKLDEMVVQSNAGLGIEDGGVGVAIQVCGDEVILGVCHDACSALVSYGQKWLNLALQRTLEGTSSCVLECLLDLVVRGGLFEHAREIDN